MSRVYEVLAKAESRAQKEERQDHSRDEGNYAEEMPSSVEAPTLLIDASPEAREEFECVYRNLLILGGNKIRSLMVCGVNKGEGATLVSLNLCALIARNQPQPVLLVESKAYSSALNRYQQGKPCEGFCELLVDHRPLSAYVSPTVEPRLFVINGGGVNGKYDQYSHALQGETLEHVVRECTQQYPFVVFDAPPLVGKSESSAFARFVDGVVLVVENGTTAKDVLQSKMNLEHSQARLIGVILTANLRK